MYPSPAIAALRRGKVQPRGGGVPPPPFCPGAFGVTSIHQGRGCRQVPCDRGRARVALGLLAARSCSGLTPARATSLRARRLFRETLLRWGCASPAPSKQNTKTKNKKPGRVGLRRGGCLVIWSGEALRLPGAQATCMVCHYFQIIFYVSNSIPAWFMLQFLPGNCKLKF